MANMMQVQAANGDGRIVIWEKHPDHPSGEIFVSGNQQKVTVARTPAVMDKLRSGDLLEIVEPEQKPVPPKPTPKTDPDEQKAAPKKATKASE